MAEASLRGTLAGRDNQPCPLRSTTQYLQLRTRLGKEKAAGVISIGLAESWLPTVDNLRNFLLTPTTEMLSFFKQLRQVL